MANYGSRHRKNRDAYLGQDNVRCWLCGDPVDMSLPKEDQMAYQLDHVKSIKRHPELIYDPANTRPSHRSCNRDKGEGDPKPGLTRTSRDWSQPRQRQTQRDKQ